MTKDSVANIRYNALRTLLILYQISKSNDIYDKINKIVKNLEKDKDYDIISLLRKINSMNVKNTSKMVYDEIK